MTITVTKVMTTETAHRLCKYAGKCAHIHGHSYRWEVTAALATRYVSDNGIAIDFAELKEVMREHIYERFDHALVLWSEDPLRGLTSHIAISTAADGTAQKIVWTPYNPTAEEFARDTAVRLQGQFRVNELALDLQIDSRPMVDIIRVRVWETANSYGQWSGV